jgi:hypothetical protein
MWHNRIPPRIRKFASWRSSRLIPMAVGSVLLCAGLMKVLYPGRSPPFDSSWSYVLWPAIIRPFCLILFTGFAAFSWIRAREGAVSCGCFGRVTLAPWLAFFLDVGVIVALVLWRPQRQGLKPLTPASQIRQRFRLGFLSLFVPLAVFPGVLAWRYDGPNDLSLTAQPRTLNLGTISQGEAVSAAFLLHNQSSDLVSLGSVRASCPCLTLSFPSHLIKSGATAKGRAHLNMAREPEFAGNLIIEVEGHDTDSKPAFRLLVQATILPEERANE